MTYFFLNLGISTFSPHRLTNNCRREEDVSKLMYKETLGANASEEIGANSKNILLPLHRVSKVNSICNAFIEVLHNRSPIRFQNVITAHVCKVPPDLDAGLEQIARIRSEFLWSGA